MVLGRVSWCKVSLVTLRPEVLLDHQGMQRESSATSPILVMGAHFLMRIRCLLRHCLLMRSGDNRRERIWDAHERATIEDEPKVFRDEVDLTFDHGPRSDSEIYSLWAFLAYLFEEFLFLDRSKGQAHLSVVWATKRLDYLERVG
ncbi:hypothetical protein AMTR_s00073p00155750 [Amborella trichopoda]|uniref:Uncharacterized protein n=1 Tax=Amborella trichopoda TaxID=13333 RepID=W1NRK4_AMBTC|nr:hypothetical protein AMTR_s00073p00155750 [Amborella trichopoda]